jgi:hypothetical protein
MSRNIISALKFIVTLKISPSEFLCTLIIEINLFSFNIDIVTILSRKARKLLWRLTKCIAFSRQFKRTIIHLI